MKSILRKIFYGVCVFFDYFLSDKNARILMYHSHLLAGAFFNVRPDDFSWQLDFLVKRGYKFVFIKDLTQMIKNKESLRKVIAITYDDGHRDFLSVAMPQFEKRNIPVTLFWPKGVENNLLKTSDGFDCPLLSVDEINILKNNKLVEVGSHGVSHRELVKLNEEELSIETKRLDGEFSFAYPRGKFFDREKEKVKESGFLSACSTNRGFVSLDSDLFELSRISIDSVTSKVAFRAKLSTLFGFYAKVRK